MKAIGIIILVALLAAAYLLFSPEQAVAVDSVRPERGDIVSYLTTNGRVEAQDRHEVFAATTGRVGEVAVKEGQAVKRGAVLAQVDDRDARLAVRQAQAQLAVAQADLKLVESGGEPAETVELESQIDAAKRDHERLRKEAEALARLVEKQAVPRIELEQTRRALAEAEAQVQVAQRKLAERFSSAARERALARIDEAQAQLAQARQRVGSASVRSPADGIVYSLAVEPGAYVSPGTLIAKVGEVSSVRIVVLVDEPELGRVALGRPMTITSDAFPAKTWECEISQLPTEIVETGSRRVGEVQCAVDNAERNLLPNLNVNVRIHTAAAESVLTLPRQAVIRLEGQDVVWIAENGAARQRPVEIGIRSDARVEIRSGIDAETEVLLPAAETLSVGQAVEIRAGN